MLPGAAQKQNRTERQGCQKGLDGQVADACGGGEEGCTMGLAYNRDNISPDQCIVFMIGTTFSSNITCNYLENRLV